MIQTGVTVTLDDQTSSSSRRVAESLAEITRRAEELNSSLDPEKLDKTLQKLSEASQRQQELGQRQQLASGIQQRNVQQTISQVGGGVAQAGRGDAVGGGVNIAQGALGFLGALGPVGIAIGAAIGLVAAGNQISKIYESRMQPAMETTALMGGYSESISENTRQIRQTMKDTTYAVSEYGKTFEEGTQAVKEYFRAGGKAGMYYNAALEASHYSTAYGADMMNLARVQGLTARYGITANPLDIVNGLMQAQGLGPGQYEELLSGMESIFIGSLSGGIVKNIVDIAQAQEYFGRAGAQYKGALGANFIQTLDQNVKAATGLDRQEDIFLYRAASGMTGGNFLDTMKLLEQGFTGPGGVDLFKKYMEQLNQFTGGDTETMIKLMTTGLGISYTQAMDVFGLYNKQGKEITQSELDKKLAYDYGRSTESDYLRDVERLKQFIVETAAEKAFDAKSLTISGSAHIAQAIIEKFTLSGTETEYRTAEQEAVRKNSYNAITPEDIEMAFYYTSGDVKREQIEEQIMQNLSMARSMGIYPESALDQYGEKIITGKATTDELTRMNNLLEQIVNNTGVTADNTGEDMEVSIPSDFQPTGSYYMPRK